MKKWKNLLNEKSDEEWYEGYCKRTSGFSTAYKSFSKWKLNVNSEEDCKNLARGGVEEEDYRYSGDPEYCCCYEPEEESEWSYQDAEEHCNQFCLNSEYVRGNFEAILAYQNKYPSPCSNSMDYSTIEIVGKETYDCFCCPL